MIAELGTPEQRERVRANPATARYRRRSGPRRESQDAGRRQRADHSARTPARAGGYFEARGAAPRSRPHADAGARRRHQRDGEMPRAYVGRKARARAGPAAWCCAAGRAPTSRNTHGLESVRIAGNRVPERRASLITERRRMRKLMIAVACLALELGWGQRTKPVATIEIHRLQQGRCAGAAATPLRDPDLAIVDVPPYLAGRWAFQSWVADLDSDSRKTGSATRTSRSARRPASW